MPRIVTTQKAPGLQERTTFTTFKRGERPTLREIIRNGQVIRRERLVYSRGRLQKKFFERLDPATQQLVKERTKRAPEATRLSQRPGFQIKQQTLARIESAKRLSKQKSLASKFILQKTKTKIQRREFLESMKAETKKELLKELNKKNKNIKDPKQKKIITGLVQEVQKPKGLKGISRSLVDARGKLRTSQLRGEKLGTLNEAKLLGIAAIKPVVDFVITFREIPQTVVAIATQPSLLKEIPRQFSKSAKDFGQLLRTSPGEAFVSLGSEYLIMRGSGAAFSKIGGLTSSQLTKLSSKFVGKAKLGSTLKIPTKDGVANLKVVGKIPKQKLSQQASLAGRRVNAISSQADRLLTLSKSKRTIKKPIPGEAKFSSATKKLLKKFDAGKATKKEVILLDLAIKKEGAKGLLERAFFADPTGKIRPSRLGIVPEKTKLLDRLFDDITLKRAKPQILFFENVKIEKLPKNLKSVSTKLKKGKTLNKLETENLLQFQLKKSSKFKPIGFISGESEITLAPGEILKKVKKIGVTIIDGRRVPIVKVNVLKPSEPLKSLISKFESNKLTNKELFQLSKLLRKETGFNYGLVSSTASRKRFVDVKKIGPTGISKLKGKQISTKSISRKVISSKKVIKPVFRPKISAPVKSIKKPVLSIIKKKKPTSRPKKSQISPSKRKQLTISRSKPSPIKKKSPKKPPISKISKKSPLSGLSRSQISRLSSLRSILSRKIKRILKLKMGYTKKDIEELKRWIKQQSFIYQPSLNAILFNIVGKKPRTITGLETRPILRKK